MGTLTLQGVGTVNAAPDVADIIAKVHTLDTLSAKALAANNKVMAELMIMLKDRGIEKRRLKSSGFGVQRRFQESSRRKPLWHVSNQIVITVMDISKLGDLLNDIAEKPDTSIDDLRFRHSEIENIKDQARALAMEDAMRKAEIYTTCTKTEIVDIKSIHEIINGYMQPMFQAACMDECEGGSPIEVGESMETITIEATFNLTAPK